MIHARVMFHAGDRVRVSTRTGRGLYHGEVPEGATGVVRTTRQVRTAWNAEGQTTTGYVVFFPGVGERIVFASTLELIRTAADSSDRAVDMLRERLTGDDHSVALAAAHRRVADAHDELRRALENLRKVEESYR